ncbi:hypothetical protein HD597_009932 [Nonomuraea thailandensis]|uniref:Uncharacterized protein n=1 Tax=Nonomuraea thailandensis TaxID=1188745 RepID=A0A9X2GSE1_9ACTN|nr:hypothetical protein [Nonomuraea thailandensis]MCP2362912.1 hypothetical protein [Nonomuraea thailandensis]
MTRKPVNKLITLGAGLAVAATALGAPPAAAAAPPEGAYWHTRAVTTIAHPWRFGTKSDPYELLQRRVSELWSAPDGKQWYGFRELGAQPATEADKKAWQRDGSPAKWSRSIDGKVVKLSAEPSRGHVSPVRTERDQFQFAGQWLTYDEVQRLPADPDRLKDWVTKAGQVFGITAESMTHWLSSSLPQLLHALPAPKEVRAGAYQALLTLPGVRAGGDAKDTLGRAGAAVVIESSSGTGKKASTVKQTLIVDTGRMVLLSQGRAVAVGGKAFGAKSYNEILVEVGWTNARPAVPAPS